MAKLTIRSISAIEPTDRDQFVPDNELPGFGLRVKPSGVKSYFIRYRNCSGDSRRYTLGKFGVLSPDAARRKAKQLLAKVADGIDPAKERKDARHADSVRDLCKLYLSDYAEGEKKASSVATDRANIENHVLPLLGRMKVKDVTLADIKKVMRQVRDGKTARQLPAKPRGRRIIKGGSGIANRVVRLLGIMFAYAQEEGMRPDNPTRGIRLYKEHPRKRYLDADELARLNNALNEAESGNTESRYAVAAFRILLYTGLRRGEVMGLRWSDVDLKSGDVRLQDTKSGDGRDVPLPTQAQAVLANLPIGKPDDFVFEGATPGTAVSLNKPWLRIRKAAGLDDTKKIDGIDESVRIHSLRHTVGTWGAAGGATELQLMQILGHKTTSTTRRYVQTVKDAQRQNSENIAQAIQAAGNGEGGELLKFPRNQS